MLKPKPGVSTLYEAAEQVLAVEAESIGGQPYVAFHLKMPSTFETPGVGNDRVVVVAVPTLLCEDS